MSAFQAASSTHGTLRADRVWEMASEPLGVILYGGSHAVSSADHRICRDPSGQVRCTVGEGTKIHRAAPHVELL